MSKFMVIPSSIEQLKLNSEAFLIGVNSLCVNMPISFSMDDVLDIINNSDKEIFVCLNKNMHVSDLKFLEDTLIKLNDSRVKAVLYYDIAVLNIVKRMHLNIELVWGQEQMGTNYETVNFWHEYGVNYALLASTITANEIISINEHTSSNIIVPIFGYIPLFVSKRHLVNNYLKCFDMSDDSRVNYIESDGDVYPIVDGNVTTVYSNHLLNGIKDVKTFMDNDIQYLLFNGFCVDNDDMCEVLDIFRNVSLENKEDSFKKISNLFNGNVSDYFLHKESIYKVK